MLAPGWGSKPNRRNDERSWVMAGGEAAETSSATTNERIVMFMGR
jgi:hypothetical protein